jgi:outer membrane protein OmpA-like peptidoglycan-associated protein
VFAHDPSQSPLEEPFKLPAKKSQLNRLSGEEVRHLNAKVTDREIHIDLAADILFDFDKYTLRPLQWSTVVDAKTSIDPRSPTRMGKSYRDTAVASMRQPSRA